MSWCSSYWRFQSSGDISQDDDNTDAQTSDSSDRSCSSTRERQEPMEVPAYRATIEWRQRAAGYDDDLVDTRPHGVGPARVRPSLLHDVLSNKADRKVLDFDQCEALLRDDIYQWKVVWHGDIWNDFPLFVYNNNTVLAMFCSHRLNPTTGRVRLLVFILTSCLLWSHTCLLLGYHDCKACGIKECRGPLEGMSAVQLFGGYRYCDHVNEVNLSALVEGLNCSEAETTGIPMEVTYRRNANYLIIPMCCFLSKLNFFFIAEHYYVQVIWSSVWNSWLGLVFIQIMSYPCCQDFSRGSRYVLYFCGRALFVIFIMSFAWRAECLVKAMVDTPSMAYVSGTVLVVQLTSWLFTSLFQIPLFALLFWLQSRKRVGSSWAWLDPPLVGRDTRGCCAWLLNPRFHVLAAEYHQAVSSGA